MTYYNKDTVNNHKCPYCDAEKGERCVTPSGRKKTNPHTARQMKETIKRMFDRKRS